MLGGFVVLSLCNRFKFKSVRLDGYRLLLHSSLAGLFLLAFAETLVLLLRSSLISFDVAFHHALPYQGSGVATLAFFLSFPICFIANLIYKVENEIDRVIDAKGDPLELILRKSLTETKPVLISVKSGKVYVGLVTYNSSPAVSVESMKIFPVRSGYRDVNTKTVEFTTDYDAVLNKILADDSTVAGVDLSDFEIVIPFREIESMTVFDPTVYNLFSNLREASKEPVELTKH